MVDKVLHRIIFVGYFDKYEYKNTVKNAIMFNVETLTNLESLKCFFFIGVIHMMRQITTSDDVIYSFMQIFINEIGIHAS